MGTGQRVGMAQPQASYTGEGALELLPMSVNSGMGSDLPLPSVLPTRGLRVACPLPGCGDHRCVI